MRASPHSIKRIMKSPALPFTKAIQLIGGHIVGEHDVARNPALPLHRVRPSGSPMTGDARLGVGLWLMNHHTLIGSPLHGVTLSADTRRRHMLVLGATGSGKTSLLLNLFAQDAARGDGILYIDPLGDDAEHALGLIPKHRRNQVCYFNVADRDHPVALNVLEDVAPRERELVADHIVTAMRALWPDMWGPRMEQILRHGLLALIEEPNASLLLLPRLLTDDAFRRRVVARCSNPLTRAFFERRFDAWRDSFREEAIDPVLNKVESFLFSPIVRNILGQSKSTLDFRHEMARSHIVIANLAKGVIGDTAAHLLGALLVARVQAAGLSRLNDTKTDHPDFRMIIDEAQDIVTDIIPTLLSQARHYRVSLTLASQYIEAFSQRTQSALLANPATLVAFRLASPDAKLLAPEFDRSHQHFNPQHLLSQSRGQATIRSAGEDAHFLNLPPAPPALYDPEIPRRQSQRHYGTNAQTVERTLDAVLNFRAA